MINIVMPVAGKGEAFKKYSNYPKPLIPIKGIPLGVVAANNIKPDKKHRFIFIFLDEHIDNWNIDKVFLKYFPNSITIGIPEVTEGTACTVLKAKRYIDNKIPLMITNCDQWINFDVNSYLDEFDKSDKDFAVTTTWGSVERRAYALFDNVGNFVRFVEKEVVSNVALIGTFNFKVGSDFVWAAEKMITENIKTAGEYHTVPAFNELVKKGKEVFLYNCDGAYFLGNPDEVDAFSKMNISDKAVMLNGQ